MLNAMDKPLSIFSHRNDSEVTKKEALNLNNFLDTKEFLIIQNRQNSFDRWFKWHQTMTVLCLISFPEQPLLLTL